MIKNNFKIFFKNYLIFLKINNLYKRKNLVNYSASVESIYNWKKKNTLNDILKWYNSIKKGNKSRVKKIHLNKMKSWYLENTQGTYNHDSKSFFRVEGYRTTNASREVGYWDQPFITQVGYVGGVIGLIRNEINGIPHYLVEAKFEPGNYNKIQISPSVQATYSNLKRAHKGKRNKMISHLKASKTIVKKFVSEDGGRFMNKRNLHWIVQSNRKIIINDKSFKWLSLWEIKQLSLKKTVISPHLRSIISLI